MINGADVRLTLATGQTLQHGTCSRTDEGWHSEGNVWNFDGAEVTNTWSTDGADCDGRMSRNGTSYFVAGDESAGWQDPESGIRFPAWGERKSRQRDYSAEAMGY